MEMPDQNGYWYQHLLTLFAIFYESNTRRTNFRIMFYVCIMCMFCIIFNLCEICTCEKPGGDPVWLTGYKLSINN